MMMQQGGLTGNSSDTPAGTSEAREPGGSGGSEAGGVFEEDKGRSEESERSSGGNRWPRQETIALLKIRSDMDVAFRDSSLKGPLWEEVSRKLAELGYHRNAKKCKEKFENVYKYHKRTKDGRTSKPDGKTYRFFEQLEALDTHLPTPSLSSSVRPQAPIQITTMAAPTMLGSTTHATTPIVTNVTVPSTPNPITTTHVFQNNVLSIMNPSYLSSQPPPRATVTISASVPSISAIHANVGESPLSISTSSSTSSDEEPEKRRKRKRKWEDFFGTLMTQVIQKQDELQKKFLETLDKRESERVMREEAWRAQEMAKMNREHELLVQERSVAAAKDAAVIAFLQKVTEHQNPQNPIVLPQLPQIQANVQQNPPPPPSAVTPPPPSAVAPPPPQSSQPPQQQVSVTGPAPAVAPPPAQAPPPVRSMDIQTGNNAGDNFLSPSPSRWPKAEVQALIQLRTTLDTKYHESGPKGPLWEEISTSMRKLGYNRNAKRCKEKWENINKYYKKVKESNKKRPEDAKTCPYFHQLEALYKEKAKNEGSSSLNPGLIIRPENPMVPIMAQPEQQWPQPQQQQQQEEENQQQDLVMEETENQKMGQNDDDDYEDVDDDEEDDEDDGAGYEIVTNKQPSSATDRRE